MYIINIRVFPLIFEWNKNTDYLTGRYFRYSKKPMIAKLGNFSKNSIPERDSRYILIFNHKLL